MADKNKELDELLTVLNSVILTRATKGGARIVEIKKDYNELCGKDIDTRKFGFDRLETLLKSFKNKFYCQGDRWFGETTKEAESIVQSMATEKSKKGKGSHKPSFERGLRTRSSNRNMGPPRGFSLPAVQQNSSSRPLTARNDIPFHHSSSDPRFNSSQQNQKLNKDERPTSSKVSGGGTKNARIPARFGFGNTSYNIASDTTSHRSSSLSSIDENQPEMDSDTPPPGFQKVPRLASDVRRSSSVASDHARESVPRSSRGFVPNTMEEPMYPPGLDVETIKKRASTPAHSNAILTNNQDGPIQLNNLEIARKVYALLLGFPQGLKLREISQRITLPQKNDEKLHDNARIGVAVTSYKQTFTISSFGPNGVVTVNPGAPRPGSEASSPQEAFKTSHVRNSDDIDSGSDIRESGPEYDYSDHFRRPDAQYRDNEDQSYARGPYTNESESRSNRFSAPAYDPEPHRRSPTPNRSRPQNMPSDEGGRFRQGWGGERLPRPWGDRSGRRPSPDQPYEHRGGWSKDPDRYSQYSDEPPRNGYQRRKVPQEPKKYECKHKYLMDSSEVPYEEFVKLTHFVALDEFYVRFENEEGQYQDMLAQLRDDYKGELEFARPQLWLKGDGAAVWFERQWQRAVVCTSSIMNDTVSTLDVFLIDVGKTVTISKDQVLPLHSYYHKPPFAVCCTIGCFDIFHGRRPDLVEQCCRMAEAFTTAKYESLLAEIQDKIWDDKEKLKVRLCYRMQMKKETIFVPDFFVNEKIIDLR